MRNKEIEMSYDLDIANETFNYTFNLSGFFHTYLINDDGVTGLIGLSGLSGHQAGIVLSEAFGRIDRERMDVFVQARDLTCHDVDAILYDKYKAENGWGSYNGALIFLAKLMAACFRNPGDVVDVCQ
jgi:hypothetical protein